MVTENGRQYRLKLRKCHFGPQFGGFTDSVFKNYISAQLNKIFLYFMYLVTINHPFKYLFGICLCSILTCLLYFQILAKNDTFSILAILTAIFCNHSNRLSPINMK